jgi:pimeloyl-ACP methyl ester carboxylesterase
VLYEDLREVILVGHSYGGMVITGAADRAAGRVGRLVYLDAANPVNGQSLLDVAGPIIEAVPPGTVVDGVELVLLPSPDAGLMYGVTDPAGCQAAGPASPNCRSQPRSLA